MSLETRSLIATFRTSHDALRAEREVRTRGIEAELIPVPREIASDCGFCLLMPEKEGRAAVPGIDAESAWLVAESRIGEGLRKEKRYERIA